MDVTIERFRTHYAAEIAAGISSFLESHGWTIIDRLAAASSRPRSTIYLFGNGGSHAISKCLEYALQSYASNRGSRIRVQTGVDIHKATLLSNNGHPGISFVEVLKTESADSNDLVVVISGSGDSDNLCEVAKYATRNCIPVLGLLGSAGGKLAELIPKSDCFAVPLVDQQISEDIIQSVACLFESPAPFVRLSQTVKNHVNELQRAIAAVPVSFIAGAAQAVVDSFINRKFTWVLGLDHPALSVCAEHVAHNLYWDGIYEVSNPPPRVIFSSPTACDFSGISNDRRRGIVELLTGVSDFKGPGVALLFSLKCESALLSLLERLHLAGIRGFLLLGDGAIDHRGDLLTTHKTGLKSPQLQALLAQVLGHMLGRVIRLKLIEQRGARRHCDVSNPAQFLIDFDLAQRRLLDHEGRA